MTGPPNVERRPPIGTGATTKNNPRQEATNAASVTADDLPADEPRSGDVVKRTQSRDVSGECRDCAATFASSGTAASHARASRHRVAVDYRTRFTFLPGELLDQLATHTDPERRSTRSAPLGADHREQLGDQPGGAAQ